MGVMTSLGIIILLIAAIGVVNTMLMSIYERTHSIGILKALGASNSDIKSLFIAESSAIGLLGGVFGIIIGVITIKIMQEFLNGYLYSQGFTCVNIFSVQIWVLLASIVFSTLIALLAGLYPATRAAKLNPIAALRQE